MKLQITIAAAALLLGAPVLAQAPTAKATVAAKTSVKVSKTTTTKTTPAMTPAPAAKPAPAAAPVAATTVKTTRTRTKTATAAPNGRMVQAKLSNGKTVTYNCSLAGNKTKKACQ